MSCPVIFVPGLGCSKLSINGNLVIPTAKGGISNLKLDSNGNDLKGNVVEAQDILLDISSDVPVYSPLVNFFVNHGFVFQNAVYSNHASKNTLYAFPYDFRKDIRIASNSLEKFVNHVMKQSGSDKVILISHSMGNLVSLDFTLRQRNCNLVSKLICIAPPFDGVPQTYASLRYGMEFPMPKTAPTGLGTSEFKELIVNWQGLYQLLPFNHYDDASNGFYCKQNENISLREIYDASDSLNKNMISRAKSWKEELVHKWEESDFENIHLILGRLAENKTICKIHEDDTMESGVSFGMCAGDGTIPIKSCEEISPDPGMLPIIHKYVYEGIDAEHNALTRNPQVLQEMLSIVNQG
ncbi:MAG TPA: alpha/beta hydrolase [Candidatus Nitrosotalea sp.]|nr:alpha/beta hydrolase [Candidatus Nitrosotalea sp.]